MSQTASQPSPETTKLTPLFAPLPVWQTISGMSRSRTYELLAVGKLRAVKCGKRTLVDVEHGLAYIRSLPAAKFTASLARKP